MAALDLTSAEIGAHAQFQMQRRGISAVELSGVLAEPERTTSVREGRIVVQGPIHRIGNSGVYLLRAFIDVDSTPPVVVTVYLTSKIAKCRGQS
jgi:hypothetical protein